MTCTVDELNKILADIERCFEYGIQDAVNDENEPMVLALIEGFTEIDKIVNAARMNGIEHTLCNRGKQAPCMVGAALTHAAKTGHVNIVNLLLLSHHEIHIGYIELAAIEASRSEHGDIVALLRSNGARIPRVHSS
jgi:hypothetical protein